MAEEAPYKVKERLGHDAEIRHYDKQVWILYHHPDNDKAFTHLLSYIEGMNESGQKTEMAVPVVSGVDEEGYFLAFILPTGIDKAPIPLDKGITLKDFPERDLAVIPLFGYASPESFDRDKKALENILKEKNRKTKGDAMLLQYSGPWTPPMQQRKEVAYEV